MNILDRPYSKIWNTALALGDKWFSNERAMARPLRIHLEVTDFCNLKCPHCPRENPDIPKNTGHLPIEMVRKLEPWFRSAAYVGLAGNGESFLHPNIVEILQIITRAGAAPCLTTNATLWKKLDVFDKIVGMGPMILVTSIDGGTKATFEKWRKNADFESVRENLRLMKAAKERAGTHVPMINFLVCLMKDNIGEVEQIVDMGAEAGASVISFQNMYPYNKAMDDERVKDMEQCREAITKARARANQYGIRIDWLPMSVDIDDRLETEGGSYGHFTAENAEKNLHKAAASTSNGGPRRLHCDNVMQQVHITVSGDIKFCCFWTEGAVGNLGTMDLGEAWNGNEWRQLRRDLKSGEKPKSCVNCHNLVVHDKTAIWKGSKKDIKDLWYR